MYILERNGKEQEPATKEGIADLLWGNSVVKFAALLEHPSERVLIASRKMAHTALLWELSGSYEDPGAFVAGLVYADGAVQVGSESLQQKFGRDRPQDWDSAQQDTFLQELSQEFLRILKGNE